MFKSIVVKKVAANTTYQIIGKVISMLITVLATLIVTRSYGREGYGEFNLMQTWPALFFVIVDFGLNAIATREISKDKSKTAAFLGNILLFRIVFSILLMTILFLTLQFSPFFGGYNTSLKFGIYLSLLMILTQALFTTTNIVFQTELRYDLSTFGYLTGYVFILLGILILSYFKASVAWVSFTYVFGGLVTYLVNIRFLKSLGVDLKLAFDPSVLKYLLGASLPLGFMFLFSQINFKADSILISTLKLPSDIGLNNTESVAVYGLPYKIFEVSLVVPTFFMNSVYPILVRHLQEDRQKMLGTFFRAIGALSLLGLLASIVGVLFAPLAIDLLGGAQFAYSVPVLRILLAGTILYYLTQPIAWLLVTLDRQILLPFIYAISAVFNVTANFYFIPRYSFFASSIITHVSELIVLILLCFCAAYTWKKVKC